MWEAIIGAAIAGVTALFNGAKKRGETLKASYIFWDPFFGKNNWPPTFSKWLWGEKKRRNQKRAVNLTSDLLGGNETIWREFISVTTRDNRMPPKSVVDFYFKGASAPFHWVGDECENEQSDDFSTHIPRPLDPSTAISTNGSNLPIWQLPNNGEDPLPTGSGTIDPIDTSNTSISKFGFSPILIGGLAILLISKFKNNGAN